MSESYKQNNKSHVMLYCVMIDNAMVSDSRGVIPPLKPADFVATVAFEAGSVSAIQYYKENCDKSR